MEEQADNIPFEERRALALAEAERRMTEFECVPSIQNKEYPEELADMKKTFDEMRQEEDSQIDEDSGFTTDNKWFREKEVMWPGQQMSLRVKKTLLDTRSLFQHIQVFQSETYGRVLSLDGVIQLTERDEFSYQESLVHTALFSHASNQNMRVLLIGGGDGGMLREICKHKNVKEIVMVEIDEGVINASKQFFSDTLATCFNDPRLTLIIGDGAAYVETARNFDCLLVDSSDPVGPASVLFENKFYKDCSQALNHGGVMCNQGECMWLHLDVIKPVLDHCRTCFKETAYFFCSVPTYPSGQIGFILGRKGGDSGDDDSALPPLGEPTVHMDEEMQSQMRYYNEACHRASFALPEFARRALAE